MRVKSSGLARGLANARRPGSATFANAPPLGLTRRANAPQLPGGGWAQVELTDALSLCYNYYRLCETEYMLKFHFNCYDKGKKAKEKNALSAAC